MSIRISEISQSRDNEHEVLPQAPVDDDGAGRQSVNEQAVQTTPLVLEPHVRVIRPARPSLAYERAE